MCSMSADLLSLNGFEGVPISSTAFSRETNHGDHNVSIQHTSSSDHVKKTGDLSAGNSARNPASEPAKHPYSQLFNSEFADSQSKSEGPSKPVFLDEIASSVDENAGKGDGLLDNCGILPGNCLPCLASTVPPIEKRRSLSSSPPSARKKAALKLSFKWKDGHPNNTLREYYTTKFGIVGFSSWNSDRHGCISIYLLRLLQIMLLQSPYNCFSFCF